MAAVSTYYVRYMYYIGNWNSARKVAKPGGVCVCVCVGRGGGEFAGGLLPQKIFKFILGSRKCDFQRSAGHYSKSIRRKLQ